MKKTLLTAVSVAALLGFGSAAYATGNENEIHTTGNNNTSEITQQGNNNILGDVTNPNRQTGDNNVLFIDQVGNRNGTLSETRSRNGNPGGVSADTIGDLSTTVSTNGGPTGAFARVNIPISQVRQLGDNNSARINSGDERDGRGNFNFFSVLQQGNRNTLEGTNQNSGGGTGPGDDTFAQSGEKNMLVADQQSNQNTIRGDQIGDKNLFAATQSGSDTLDALQQGNRNRLVSYQGGGNTAVVSQQGNGNNHTNVQLSP